MNRTPTPKQHAARLDQSQAEATLYRVAVSAFTYYPEKTTEDPGYTVDEDVTWCATPLADLPASTITDLRASIRTLITDPTADRRAFLRALSHLTEDKPTDAAK